MFQIATQEPLLYGHYSLLTKANSLYEGSVLKPSGFSVYCVYPTQPNTAAPRNMIKLFWPEMGFKKFQIFPHFKIHVFFSIKTLKMVARSQFQSKQKLHLLRNRPLQSWQFVSLNRTRYSSPWAPSLSSATPVLYTPGSSPWWMS